MPIDDDDIELDDDDALDLQAGGGDGFGDLLDEDPDALRDDGLDDDGDWS